MADLVEFLLARIAEDERLIERGRAHSALDRCMTPNRIAVMPVDGGWELVLDYERVLAECEAKRRIVEQYEARENGDPDVTEDWRVIQRVVAYLASVYADHPAYDPEWRR